MTDKCTGWAIVATMERPNKTNYTETITDIDDSTASIVDDFLTEYCEDKIINETVPHNDIKEANNDDRNKIEDKDWEILRDNFLEQALDMSTDELADYYANHEIDNIKKHDRMDWFNNGVLPCKKCNQFYNDCECDEESEENKKEENNDTKR